MSCCWHKDKMKEREKANTIIEIVPHSTDTIHSKFCITIVWGLKLTWRLLHLLIIMKFVVTLVHYSWAWKYHWFTLVHLKGTKTQSSVFA